MTESGRRLSYDEGQWSLETSELVRLDRNLYRPEKRRIDGVDAILSHLRSRGEGALVSGAERLIRAADVEGSSYEAHEGEWVVSAPVPTARPSRTHQLSDEMSELRAEVVLLRAAYAGVLERLRKLERGSDSAGQQSDVVALPGAPAVVTALEQLVGEGLELRPVDEPLPASAAEFSELDACLLVDERGRERAAVLSDHRATVECGGSFRGVPADAIEEQIRSGEAETDLVVGMNEIFSKLSALLGRQSGNPRLTAEPLTKAPIQRLPWLTRPSAVLALSTGSGGRLWLVAR